MVYKVPYTPALQHLMRAYDGPAGVGLVSSIEDTYVGLVSSIVGTPASAVMSPNTRAERFS